MPGKKAKTKESIDELTARILGPENLAVIQSAARELAEEGRKLQNKHWDKIRNLPYEPPVWKIAGAVREEEDLQNVPTSRQHLVISGKAKNLARLAEFPHIEF